MSSPLQQEQEDIHGRLAADTYFADLPVLLARKGVTDSDIEIALSTLNAGGTGKIGAVAVVLMPTLRAEPDNVPAPVYVVQHTVQVIEDPLFSQDATSGVLKSAEEIAHRVRLLLNWFNPGGAGSLAFDGMDPAEVKSGVSYLVRFSRRTGDDELARVATPVVSADSASAPATVTLTCATSGAAIYYTTDGSYPSSANDDATLYSTPFSQPTAATIRAAAEKSGLQQSNVSQLILT